ncbi:MAG: lamin tail domain-containing protein [Methanothrix sp.]|nr:lamin tail domain-containing protein [Methanothrix sp.]
MEFCILLSLVLLVVSSPAAASELSLSAPAEVDVCGAGAYGLSFVCSAEASSLLALVEVPEGFQYAGNSRAIFGDRESDCQPVVSGRSLSWDLSLALKACRHVVINEWEQNPKGTDGGKEWIELYNPSSQDVDIGGWRLVDSYYRKTVFIPSGTVLVAGRYLVVPWTNGTLINSYLTKVTLFDFAGREVDCTREAKDDKDSDLCWARYPDGKDLGNDLEWRFQASTKGGPNGGISSDIYAGESLALAFNLTAGCGSTSPAALLAELSSSAGSFSAQSPSIAVRRANLRLSATPDKFEVAEGDEVVWTLQLENAGNGTAYSVQVEDSLGRGLQLMSIDSPGQGLAWSYAALAPGAVARVELKAKVVLFLDSYSNLLNASWGYGPCQEVGLQSQVSPRTALRKQPDNSRSLVVGDLASYEIFADLPGGARTLWINDTIPKGLSYNRSSLSMRGLTLQRELLTSNGDGSMQVSWFFGDVGPAQSIEIDYNCLLANSPENQDGSVLAGTRADMSWTDEQGLKTDGDEAGALTVAEPDLVLEMQASDFTVAAGENLSFTLAVYHSSQSHASAFDVDLEDVLPEGLVYSPGSAEVLSGPAATFDASAMKWHFEDLDLAWDEGNKVLLRFNAAVLAKPGDEVVNSAKITWTSLAGDCTAERTGLGGINDYQKSASCRLNAMSLSISMRAEPEPVEVGELLTYTLAYENEGRLDANNVIIIDEQDPRISFLSSDPAPDNANNTWEIPRLAPDGPHSITIRVRVSETLAHGALLANRFSIKCDELGPKMGIIYTEVLNGTRLEVNKTALQKAVRRGEEVSYVIKVCNSGGQPATNITVRDVFDSSVEFVSAWPPQAEDGVWRFGRLDPGECVEIGLTVRIPRTDVKYESHQAVKGEGFVRTYRDYTTSREPSVLTNRVYVVSDQMQHSALARVLVLGEEGTDLSIREHGSGAYENKEDLRFLTENKSIRMNRSIRANYYLTDFLLPCGGSQSFSSLWSVESHARNGLTNTSFKELYRYSTRLDTESHFNLDKNGSLLEIKSDLQGLANLGTLKRPVNFAARGGDTFTNEEYAGIFRIQENIYDFGQDLVQDRSVSGGGYVASDTQVGNRQRSHESGTGTYRSEERIETLSSFMAKDMGAAHGSLSYKISSRTSLNLSQKWAEGMWSKSASSLISEEISSAGRLKKKAVAASLKELESETSFSGKAEFRTGYGKSKSPQVEQDALLVGDYQVTRKIILSGVSRYDEPHLYLRKDGHLQNDVAAYTISITNDGNASLGPLFLWDLFPCNARFLNSSMRPSQLDQNSSSWTLVHLAIGDTLKIEIHLDVKRCDGDIINRVKVAGNCSLGQAKAWNQSIINRAWLGSCSPAKETARPAGISCACSKEERSNETLYFDPVLAQWDDGDDSSCPLSCPEVEAAHESVKP